MGTAVDEEKSRLAVDVIAANCGAGTKKLITSDRTRFKDAKVRALAGTSPEYQRHVIGRAVSGDTNPFRMISATLLVYDTVAFAEVTSRLPRALGMIRKEAAVLERAIEAQKAPDRLADRLLTLDLIAEQADRLHELLIEVETVDGSSKRKSKSRKSDSELTDKLYAAGGLGLIAKNVRNVAVLQPTHRPTLQQKELALELTRTALQLARRTRDSVRREFGRADDVCHVRPGKAATRRVITHDRIDGDGVVAAWFAEQFLFEGVSVEILFVPPNRELGAYRVGDCLVDVGRTHDPKNLFFDHKPPACADKRDSCATRQVWDHLAKLGRDVKHLKPLVNVVFAEHSTSERPWFKDEYAESKRSGFHKALADAKVTHETDAGVYRVMRQWLNRHDKKTATRKD